MQMVQPGSISSINLDAITCLAERFLMHPEKHIAYVTENCRDFESSKTLLFLVLMQSFLMQKNSMFPVPLLNQKYVLVYLINIILAVSLFHLL